jgi:hypothetical protein
LLSDPRASFQKTHDIEALMGGLTRAGARLPDEFEDLGAVTPFGALFRYEEFDSALVLDRRAARSILLELRVWIEARINESEVDR